MALIRGNEIPTIDVVLVTITPYTTVEGVAVNELGLDTSSQVAVEPDLDEQDAITLIIKGRLRAQKPKVTTVTGNTITLTDNVFNPELVQILQGGTIEYSTTDPTKVVSYTPPITGSGDKGEVFKLTMYSARYDTSGQIVEYEKIEYPNCQGQPISISAEDDVFRIPEYTITSAPKETEAPYAISYVSALPAFA